MITTDRFSAFIKGKKAKNTAVKTIVTWQISSLPAAINQSEMIKRIHFTVLPKLHRCFIASLIQKRPAKQFRAPL